MLFALGSAVLLTTLVFGLVKQSIWEELEILIAGLSVCLFAFLFVLLYRGVRFDRNHHWSFGWVHPRSLAENIPLVDSLGHFTEAGAQQGIAGFLIGLLLDLVVSLVLILAIIVLLWLGINLVLTAVGAIWLTLIYLFRRSVRYIVARGRPCRGHVRRAAGWAALYTVMNAGWLYIILAIGRRIAGADAANGT